jgi:DNA invertase Pin-like site-specific DNA recombinase
MSKTILYARTSTADQTVEIQRQQAEHAGFVVDQVIEDAGVSGVQTSLAERPNGKRLFDILRDGDTLVVRWVDRLGRNYDDIQTNIREFINRGVTIKTVINNMVFDAKPTDAMAKAVRDAMLSFMSAMAEAQTMAMKEAQAAGIENAKANNPLAYRGRKPSYTFDQVLEVMEKFEHGIGVNQIAREVGLSKFAVSRITRNPEAARERLYLWEDLKNTDSVS